MYVHWVSSLPCDQVDVASTRSFVFLCMWQSSSWYIIGAVIIKGQAIRGHFVCRLLPSWLASWFNGRKVVYLPKQILKIWGLRMGLNSVPGPHWRTLFQVWRRESEDHQRTILDEGLWDHPSLLSSWFMAKTRSHVFNSKHFGETLRGITLWEDELLVSWMCPHLFNYSICLSDVGYPGKHKGRL